MVTPLESNRRRRGAKAVCALTILVALLCLATLTIDAGSIYSLQDDPIDFLCAFPSVGLQSEPDGAAQNPVRKCAKIDSRFGEFVSDSEVDPGIRNQEVSDSPWRGAPVSIEYADAHHMMN